MDSQEKPSELKESLILAGDVAKHLVFEGRLKLATGFYNVGKAVDLNCAQRSFIKEMHQKLDKKARDRKAAKLQPVTA